MSFAGSPWCRTPHMDSIASNGVCFLKSYCPFPLCSPSRAALHAGRPPHEIGVDRNDVPIAPGVPISGEIFSAAGYDTGYAGKWHLPEVYPSNGIPGFEVLNRTSRRHRLARDVDEDTMNAAIEFLRRPRERPFYLVVSFINPHDICLLAGEDSALTPRVWELYGPPSEVELPALPPNFSAEAIVAQRAGGAARATIGTSRCGGGTATLIFGWSRTSTDRSGECSGRCAKPVSRSGR